VTGEPGPGPVQFEHRREQVGDQDVLIGWNGPRISAGAVGFMSQVSSWLGPPSRNSMMQLTSLSFAPAASLARR
jgi:hypothetical protein